MPLVSTWWEIQSPNQYNLNIDAILVLKNYWDLVTIYMNRVVSSKLLLQSQSYTLLLFWSLIWFGDFRIWKQTELMHILLCCSHPHAVVFTVNHCLIMETLLPLLFPVNSVAVLSCISTSSFPFLAGIFLFHFCRCLPGSFTFPFLSLSSLPLRAPLCSPPKSAALYWQLSLELSTPSPSHTFASFSPRNHYLLNLYSRFQTWSSREHYSQVPALEELTM